MMAERVICFGFGQAGFTMTFKLYVSFIGICILVKLSHPDNSDEKHHRLGVRTYKSQFYFH